MYYDNSKSKEMKMDVLKKMKIKSSTRAKRNIITQ